MDRYAIVTVNEIAGGQSTKRVTVASYLTPEEFCALRATVPGTFLVNVYDRTGKQLAAAYGTRPDPL